LAIYAAILPHAGRITMSDDRSTAGIKLPRGNYLRVPVGYSDEILIPATAKTIDAYNLLFGPDALRVSRHWDDDGEYFQIAVSDTDVTFTSSDRLQRGLRARIVKEGDE